MSEVISAQISDSTYKQIEEETDPAESESAAVRRAIKAGLHQTPNREVTITVLVFSLTLAGLYWFGADRTVIYFHSAVFHFLAVVWVLFPRFRKAVYSLRE